MIFNKKNLLFIINDIMKKYLYILPLVLATSSVYAAWKSNSADSEEAPMNNVTTNDEDRAAFIDLSKMVAAGDI